jgi:hypothetical protein
MASTFENTQAAIVFALNYSAAQYPQSPISQGGIVGSGKGLVAMAGAGEAGLILSAMSQMDKLKQACIAARYAPKSEKCKCCGGDAPTAIWKEAINTLQEWSMSTFSGISKPAVREAIILNFYERGVSIADAAKQANMPVKTAYNQRAKIHAALAKLDPEAQQEVADILESKGFLA